MKALLLAAIVLIIVSGCTGSPGNQGAPSGPVECGENNECVKNAILQCVSGSTGTHNFEIAGTEIIVSEAMVGGLEGNDCTVVETIKTFLPNNAISAGVLEIRPGNTYFCKYNNGVIENFSEQCWQGFAP